MSQLFDTLLNLVAILLYLFVRRVSYVAVQRFSASILFGGIVFNFDLDIGLGTDINIIVFHPYFWQVIIPALARNA